MKHSGKTISLIIFLLLLILLLIRLLVLEKKEDSDCMLPKMSAILERMAVEREMPVVAFLEEERPQNLQQMFHETLAVSFPWYAYEKMYLVESPTVQRQEKPKEEQQEEPQETGMESERAPEMEPEKEVQEDSVRTVDLSADPEESEGTEAEEEQEQWREWADHQKEKQTDLEKVLDSYSSLDTETILHRFYTVDRMTDSDAAELTMETLVQKKLPFTGTEEGYQILIYHTHAAEQYADSENAKTEGVMGAGAFLAELLEEYGYRVLHLEEQFDAESRENAYANALPVLEQTLKENPGIFLMIDLHRDEVDEAARLVNEVDGRPVARYMFFNGLSYTNELGKLENLPNSNLADNLALSFRMQAASEALFPGNARKIYLKGYRYNLHLSPGSLLIELGAQNTTEQEARDACVLLAKVLDTVLCYDISR